MVEKKPNCRTRAIHAYFAANRARRKLATAEAQQFAEAARSCKQSNPGDLLAQLMPDDLTEARIHAGLHYCDAVAARVCQVRRRAWYDEREVRRERDRALARLEAAAHRLSMVGE